jgi:hypothetical protein
MSQSGGQNSDLRLPPSIFRPSCRPNFFSGRTNPEHPTTNLEPRTCVRYAHSVLGVQCSMFRHQPSAFRPPPSATRAPSERWDWPREKFSAGAAGPACKLCSRAGSNGNGPPAGGETKNEPTGFPFTPVEIPLEMKSRKSPRLELGFTLANSRPYLTRQVWDCGLVIELHHDTRHGK